MNRQGSLVQRTLASFAVPASLRPDVREVSVLFKFRAVSSPDGGTAIDYGRFVALIDGLGYFNASRKDLEVRIASNSKTFQRIGEDLESNAWQSIWPYFRAVSPLVPAQAYFSAITGFLDDEESDIVLLRPIFLRIVHDTARCIVDKTMPTGLRFVHTGVRLAAGPAAVDIARLIGLIGAGGGAVEKIAA
ncbi:MAG: hypothetical protein OSA97_18525 [Nevskia sp.]|nr:hypothetical protein [Nevskia sp.]